MRNVIKVFLFCIISLFIIFEALISKEENITKNPVFFVHGHGMSSKSWNSLIKYLKKTGYPSRFLRAIQLHPNNGSNIEAAKNQIAPEIDKFLKEINKFLLKKHPLVPLKSKVDIVSHSMGGLSSRWYATRVCPNKVHKWISIAGANHGTNDLCPHVGRGGGEGADKR